MAEGGQAQQAQAPQLLALAPGDIQALGQAIANGIVPPAPAAQAPSGVRKIPLFEETGDATAWATWITRFETVANIARWDAARMKAELKAGMSEAAALVTRDINIQDPRTLQGQGRLPGPFHHPGGQRPSEGGLFSGPTGGR